MARAQDLLTHSAWEGASIGDIVMTATEPFKSRSIDSAIEASGPRVDLPRDATMTLALILHELATNASKYGSLSAAGGSVRIVWDAIQKPECKQVVFSWIEKGGPAVEKPTREGFGSRLITMSAAQLDGAVEFEHAATGLHCRLQFPLKDVPQVRALKAVDDV